MRTLLACVAGVLCLAVPQPLASPQAVNSAPSRATVFIRLIGGVEIDPAPDLATAQALRQADVELASGSGFLFSPYGHVLTCAHVVHLEPTTMLYQGVRTRVRPIVRRIEVLQPAEDSGGALAPFDATVVATDADLDLAALSISTGSTPYLHLGDSDAAEGGDPVEAIGYPFGRRLEIAQPSMPETTAPTASISRGNVSASRADAQGERRYLQTTAALNAGNSGGPVLDADGYVVGIANSVFAPRGAATGVGFAVPVNLAKGFLEAHSLDHFLAARRTGLGPLGALEDKGIRIALPEPLADRSPIRSRVDTGGDPVEALALHVDRVLSAWPATRLAEALTSGQAFEPFSAASAPSQRTVEANGRRLLLGRVAGTVKGGAAVRMEYAIIELGAEKIIARYIGPPHQLAFSASVLRASLRGIEVESLRPSSREASPPPSWEASTTPPQRPLDRIVVPSGWIREPVGPYRCPGLPAPADAVSMSRPNDFAVALRAAWLRGAGAVAEAAGACGGQAGSESGAYEREVEALGTRYLILGKFVSLPDGDLIQLEGSGPLEQAAPLRAAFARWAAEGARRP